MMLHNSFYVAEVGKTITQVYVEWAEVLISFLGYTIQTSNDISIWFLISEHLVLGLRFLLEWNVNKMMTNTDTKV